MSKIIIAVAVIGRMQMENQKNLLTAPYPTGTIEPDELVMIRQQLGGCIWGRT